MKRFLNMLARADRGAAVIELALVAPILAVMVVGVIDMSNAMGRKLQIEQAAQRSLEMVLQTTGDTTADAAIVSEVVDEGNVEASEVVVQRLLECDAVPVADITQNCDDDEVEARYFKVTVTTTYEPMFPMHWAGMNEDGTYPVKAVAGMRIQ